MKEILPDLERWWQAGEKAAVARVVDLEGSGPRSPGAAMAVTADAEVVGSVSGGCVEGAVVTESLEVIAAGDRHTQDQVARAGVTVEQDLDQGREDHKRRHPETGCHGV